MAYGSIAAAGPELTHDRRRFRRSLCSEDPEDSCLRKQEAHHGTAPIRDLQWLAGTVGQPPLGWHAPNGYVDTAAGWASTSATLGKWNVHMGLAGQWWPAKLNYPKLSTLVPKPRPA